MVAGLVAGVLVFLMLTQLYGSLPPLPAPAGVTLLAIAAIDTGLAISVRFRIRSRRTLLTQALNPARTVALAKASSLLGAIMLGAWLGVLGYLVPKQGQITAAANDLPSSIIGIVCSMALIAAALWLEWCCRVPRDQDEQPPERRSGTPS